MFARTCVLGEFVLLNTRNLTQMDEARDQGPRQHLDCNTWKHCQEAKGEIFFEEGWADGSHLKVTFPRLQDTQQVFSRAFNTALLPVSKRLEGNSCRY